MIVRILGEGQFDIGDAGTSELNRLDTELEAAVERNDEPGFRLALGELLAQVRSIGSPVEAAALEPTELILPEEGATMAEVRQLLTGAGLIPG